MSNTQTPADIMEAAKKEYPDDLRTLNYVRQEGYIAGATAERDRDKWVKVEDGLPKRTEVVLIWTNASLYAVLGLWCGDTWIYANIETQFLIRNQPHIIVTHWQPLPTVPTDFLADKTK